MHLYDVYCQCSSCGKFNLIKGSKETHGHATSGVVCEYCRGNRWELQTVISTRTFDLERTKRKEAQYIKQINTRASRF